MFSRLHKLALTALLATSFSLFSPMLKTEASVSVKATNLTIEKKPNGTMGAEVPTINNYAGSMFAHTSLSSYGRAVPDLSEWQGSFTDAQAKSLKKEVPFVILRVQYGSSYYDKTFNHNRALVEKYKIPYGVYSFSQYRNSTGAKKEAKLLHQRAPRASFYVNDYEDQTVRSGSTNTATKAWVSEMRKHSGSKKVLLYSYASFMKKYASSAVKSYDGFWLAAYQNTKPSTPHVLWQYTNSSYLSSLKKRVDASVSSTHSVEWFLGSSSKKKLVTNNSKYEKANYYSGNGNQVARLSSTYKNNFLYNHVKNTRKHVTQYKWSSVKPAVGKKVYIDYRAKKTNGKVWYRIRFSANVTAKRYWLYTDALDFPNVSYEDNNQSFTVNDLASGSTYNHVFNSDYISKNVTDLNSLKGKEFTANKKGILTDFSGLQTSYYRFNNNGTYQWISANDITLK